MGIDDLADSEIRRRLLQRGQSAADTEHIIRHREEPTTRRDLARFLGLDE